MKNQTGSLLSGLPLPSVSSYWSVPSSCSAKEIISEIFRPLPARPGHRFFSAGCSKTQQTGASLDSAFRAGISPDAQTLISVRLDQLKSSQLYQRHQELLDVPRLNDLATRAGLDPRKDIASLCLIWDGKNLVLLAKGSFSSAQVQQRLVSGGAQKVAYKNGFLFTHGDASVSFPKEGLLVASSTPAVQSELDLLSSKDVQIPDELKARLAEIPSDAQIWAVSRGGLPGAGLPFGPSLESAMSNFASFVTGTSFGLRVDTGSHFHSLITCKSPEGAQRVNDAMRGLVGLARLTTKDNELEMLRLWDAISITKDQQVVRIQADIPADLSDKLIQQMQGLRGRVGPMLRPN